MKYLLYVLCSIAPVFVSCSQQGGSGENLERVPIFKVSPSSSADATGKIAIDGRRQNLTFTVMASGEWTTAWMSDEGLSLLTGKGSAGRTDVLVSASENTSGAERSATLAFLFRGEVRYDYLITQGETSPYVEINIHDHTASGFSSDLTVTVDSNEPWTWYVDGNQEWVVEKDRGDGYVTFTFPDNDTGETRMAHVIFCATSNPAIFDELDIVQNAKAPAPVADLLDMEFQADGSAKDVSAAAMAVNLIQDGTVSTKYIEKYGRYAGVFSGESSRSPSASGEGEPGHFRVPYAMGSDFAAALADGYTLELLFCRYDDPGTKQVKPFASTQAGGTGICFRAKEGNEINYELHTNGSWVELYSGITPVKGTYYHVVGTYDKVNAVADMYVDCNKVASRNANGSFDFMVSNVDSYFFGIGADPNPNGLGELSFNGEVVIARIYNEPVNGEQVRSMYELVK